ncbi:Uncharacterised protein g1125 [Pycnogonum litorale]
MMKLACILSIISIVIIRCESLDPTVRQKFLDEHNYLREKLNREPHQFVPKDFPQRSCYLPQAKSSTPIPSLMWDDALASAAQEHANKCNMVHTKSGDRKDKANSRKSSNHYQYVGENLAVRYAWNSDDTCADIDTSQLVSYSVQGWINEAKNYGTNTNACKQMKSLSFNAYDDGHLTQVLWAGTTYVGCGIKRCPIVTVFSKQKTCGYLVVCNYGEGGNYGGSAVYQTNC